MLTHSMQGIFRVLSPVVALILALPVAAYAQAATLGENLTSLIEYAKAHNPDYKAARHDAAAARERVVPAGALPDPMFRVELQDITRSGEQNPTFSPSRVGQTRYRIMQTIPWFGKRDLKQEVAEMEAIAAKARENGSLDDLSARIKIRYAQLYYLHRNQALSHETLKLLRQMEKIAHVRYGNGLSPQQDVIRAQVEQTQVESELALIDSERVQVESRLNALLFRPANAPLAQPAQLRSLPEPDALHPARLEDRLRARNPELASINAQVNAAEKSRQLTYKNRYPDLSVGVSPVQSGGSIKQWGVMFEVNIPLQQSSRRSKEREAEANLASAQARQEAMANNLRAELASDVSALGTARRIEVLAKDSLVPQAELSFKSALVGYENGKVSFTALLNAQRQILNAKRGLYKAQADGQTRLAEIERLLGEDL